MITEELLEQLLEKRKRLDELKASSSEIAEAVQLAEDYHLLMQRLIEQYKETVKEMVPFPVPYPVYPQPDWTYRPQRYDWWNPSYRIICTTSTGTSVAESGTASGTASGLVHDKPIGTYHNC